MTTTWQGSPDARPSARIASLAPALQRTERRVVEAIAADRERAVECTAQALAERVGVGRTTVIRAAQSLGYDGYPQLRVALVQELALEGAAVAGTAAGRGTTGAAGAAGSAGAGGAAGRAGSGARGDAIDPTILGALRVRIAQLAARLDDSMAALTPEAVDAFVQALDSADRLLVVANGLSSPIGLDFAMRLNSAGRSVEQFADPMAQQIAARQLGAGSVCAVFSGSGANRATLDVMGAARLSGARVIAITSFARSAVEKLSDVTLVVPPVGGSFHDELIHTSRAALMLLTEHLVDAFVEMRGDRGRDARSAVLTVLADALEE
ncbi:MurR/RpiR family transcriptional regulator [Leucobacter manosquensis]|uniref:MurR/RpiR family transcriptional regulator n=1 Tax=Leucobacter manosquensis TaxID=2810611 RepID=A0ABS5M2R7_9MICO|nr:MurR/RpiR family transcriptional regulator [Leucobacter manosquensis]MBS3181498.1 MurR/RpiR family transcriptional regulator [Leucobacter manosquensis]